LANGLQRTIAVGFWCTLLGVFIFLPLSLIWSGTIVIGGLSDNPAILGLITLAAIPVWLFISGWIAETGVRLGH
jgi:hypothetical protein